MAEVVHFKGQAENVFYEHICLDLEACPRILGKHGPLSLYRNMETLQESNLAIDKSLIDDSSQKLNLHF